MTASDNPIEAFRTGGLMAARQVIAAQYPAMRAAIEAARGTPSRGQAAKGLIGAICANDQDMAATLVREVEPAMHFESPLRLSPLLSLQTYCRQNGYRYDVMIPSQHVDIAPTTPFSRALSYDTETAVLAVIPGAQFVPGWDVLLGTDGTVLHDSGYQPVKQGFTAFGAVFVGDLQAIIHHAPAEEIIIDDDVLFLSAPVNNFGHWLIDFLPRLMGLRTADGRKLKVALPADLPARYGETLVRFGVNDADLIRCERGKLYRFKTATLYRPGQSMPPNPHHVRFVRDALVSGHTLAPHRGKRVYLSRASVGTRVVANAAEFEAFLVREGFITADLADLSLSEQEQLLGDADVLLGTFGSNLLGLYFAPPGCTVIAMMHDVTEDPTIAHTCAMLGMKQQYLVCEKAPTSGLQRHRKDADVIVDCALLASRLPPR